MFFVYILQSETDESFYIGYSENVERRLEQHNNEESEYTSRKTPWKIVYIEKFELKKDAIKREKFLKNQKSRDFYKRLINSWSGSLVG
jgi:putative endonuclease